MVSGGRALVSTFWEVKTSIIVYSSCGLLAIITIVAAITNSVITTEHAKIVLLTIYPSA